jgi:hypothetical protein
VSRPGLLTAVALWVTTPLTAQTGGAISGRVTDALNREPIAGVVVSADDGGAGAVTGADGRYFIRDVRPGYHRLVARAVGFGSVLSDSVLISAGQTVTVDFVLSSEAVPLPAVAVEAVSDALLDPRQPQPIQRISAADLRDLPLTTLVEAVEIQTGVVQGSFRGGRVGEDLLVVDGLGVKNQLDAAEGGVGIRIPTIALEEATLVTNAFSAQYGQALSGVISAATRDGGERIEGRIAYESDRPMPDGWDVGLDRVTASLSGPLIGPTRFLLAADAQARVDDDPVLAPAPTDTLDPRHARPWLNPHSGGERYDLLAKLTVPLGRRQTLRALGLVSETQRRLFEPALKYAAAPGPAQRVSGRLLMGHLRRTSAPEAATVVNLDLRGGFFEKEAIRGPLAAQPDDAFGAFTFSRFAFAGEDLAGAQDSVAALAAVPGFETPALVETTPWGVPAFFYSASPRGELIWNRFREGRLRADLLLGVSTATDIRLGAEYVTQRVETFTRLASFLAVSDSVPAPSVSRFSPYQAAGYAEWQQRASDLTITLGLRADAYNGRVAEGGYRAGTELALSPRFAVSTPLGPATIVVTWGRFVQPPDFQYLVDAAFDDTLRTGRFRRGNPTLGFETSTQFEFQARVRPSPLVGLKAGVFVKRLDGLVASIPLGFDPDSAIFGNGDFGEVKGLELTVEREFRGGFGLRASYALQMAEATATNARDLFRRLNLTPTGDTVYPATIKFPLDYDRRHAVTVVARARTPEGLGSIAGRIEVGAIARVGSGLPFTRTDATGDTLRSVPNSERLPTQATLDLALRRPVRLGGVRGALYLDVRNATNRRNLIAVRRDTGEPGLNEQQIAELAETAYAANPFPIPYESPRYRAWADVDGDGLVAGRAELYPLFERAARDVTQPLFVFGQPRLVRLGVELAF